MSLPGNFGRSITNGMHGAFHLGRADRLNALPDVRRLRCAMTQQASSNRDTTQAPASNFWK